LARIDRNLARPHLATQAGKTHRMLSNSDSESPELENP
jgi:hypothetical protein